VNLEITAPVPDESYRLLKHTLSPDERFSFYKRRWIGWITLCQSGSANCSFYIIFFLSSKIEVFILSEWL